MDPTKAKVENLSAEASGNTGDVPLCCIRTIQAHGQHNPMMVCTECKQIIKCFPEERAYQNYLTFCRSRRRPVLQGVVEGFYTVVFRSYETTPLYGGR